MDYAQLERDFANLSADIKDRRRRIEAYEKNGLRPVEHPSAYVFNYSLKPYISPQDPEATTFKVPVQEKTVQTKKDTVFLVKSMGHAVTVVGKRVDVGQAATITLPATSIPLVMNYRFKVRDTGSDREWQNDWVPGAMLLTGNYNSFRLRKSHALCSPGSEVTISIDATLFANNSDYTSLLDITETRLQIVLSGFEVPFKKGGA